MFFFPGEPRLVEIFVTKRGNPPSCCKGKLIVLFSVKVNMRWLKFWRLHFATKPD